MTTTTTFGRYEVLDTLSLGPHRAVYTARLPDDPSGGPANTADHARRYCVKVFTPPAPADPDEPSWETQYFLDRARTQRHVAASGGKHWAAVHDLGTTPHGAYVVVDYQPLSVQKLIDGKVPVSAAALHHVADAVVRGLVELREIAARSHGNLTAGNVRFAGQGDPADTPVVLSDPAQAHVARKEGEAGDLQALGRVLYELVTHRPFEGLAGPINAPEESREPVPPGPEWSRLGAQGEAWRLLCGELLTRQIGGRAATLLRAGLALEPLQPKKVRKPHLPSVSLPRVRLPRFGRKPRVAAPAAPPPPRRGRRAARRVLTLATTVVVLLAAAVGVMALLQARARDQIRRERAAWYGAFEKALADPARRQQYVSDEGLRPIVEDLDRAGLAAYREPAAAAAAAPTDLRSRIDFRGPRAAAAALRRAREGLSPSGWKRLGWAADLRRRYEHRGWRQPADYLAKLVKAAEPGAGSTDVAAGIDRLLQVAPRLEQDAPAAERAWQRFDESATKLELSHDETLRALGGSLRAESAAAVELTDAGFARLDAVRAGAGRAAQLAQVLDRAGRGEIDLARMAADLGNRIDPAHVRPGDADLWLRESAGYVVRRRETEQAAAELKAKLAEAESDVVAANLPAFRKERQAVDTALAEFAQRSFVARDFDGGEFANQQKQLDARIATLAERFRQTPEQWVDALPALATTSPRVNTFWDQWKQSLRSKSADMAKDRRLLRAAQRRAENLRGGLAELDKFFADVPKGLSGAFAKEAASRRDAELGKLLAAFDPENPQPDWPKAQAASDEFGKWTLDLSDLDRDFAQFRAKELATADDRPDEKWRFTQFWQDPAIQALVKADLERIARLQAVAAQPRDELIKAAAAAPQAEVALAAWRRLARHAVEPAWPARAGELEAERQIRERLTGLLAQLKNPDEAKAPLDEMQKAAPEQWRRFVAGATGEAMLRSAWDLRRAFGAGTTADVDQLPPAARYNLWLFLARQQLASGNAADDAAVQRVVEGVRAAASSMDERERPAEVRDLLARLGDVGRREAFAGAAVGDTFRLPLAGVDPPLEFRRVEPSADNARSRPFYLGTTEVTLGQYAAAVTSLNAWNDVQALPWGARLGQPDTRRGARVWEWIADDANPGGPPHMAAPLKWMAADDQNDFNDDFRAQKFNRMLLSEQVGGNPSLRHPMQQVSAQAAMHFAAMLGCRLPTGVEWRQANEANRTALAAAGAGPRDAAAAWNLKDRTWSNQYQYLLDPRRARAKWPDMGAFGVAEPSAGNRPEDDSRADNDGTLLFRPVTPLAAGGGGAAVPFQDLVGNVAEFVCDAPEAFADLRQGKPSADAVRSAAERAKGAWFVIGGSALSPKYVPVDEPLPLRRTDEGYADVGLRLAFTAPARSSAERLKWALGDAARGDRGYVWPAQAKAAPAAAPNASPTRAAG